MNTPEPDRGDGGLRKLLKEAHPPAELPPRFQEAVWRRIEAAQRSTSAKGSWIESLLALFFRPAFATAGLAILMLAGGTLGVQTGKARAQEAAQARYITAVSPLHRIAAP
jgi:hypothetical protein